MSNGNSPATKQDVIDAVNASEDRLTRMIQASGERLVEKMRDIQTEMLRAF